MTYTKPVKIMNLIGELPDHLSILCRIRQADIIIANEASSKLAQISTEVLNNPFLNDRAAESNQYIDSTYIREYFSSCSFLNLLYFKESPLLLSQIQTKQLNCGEQKKSLLAWLCLFELLQQGGVGYTDRDIRSLVKACDAYITNVRRELWALIPI